MGFERRLRERGRRVGFDEVEVGTVHRSANTTTKTKTTDFALIAWAQGHVLDARAEGHGFGQIAARPGETYRASIISADEADAILSQVKRLDGLA